MNLNYTAFALISFIPLITAFIWYHPKAPFTRWAGFSTNSVLDWSIYKIVIAFILSVALVYGYMNLIIHQLGFYELFFTDIMMGKESSKQVVEEFLAEYGQKHRHFGHGVLHGAINAFLFALPFISFSAFVDNRGKGYVLLHFSYWLLISMLMGALISAFV